MDPISNLRSEEVLKVSALYPRPKGGGVSQDPPEADKLLVY